MGGYGIAGLGTVFRGDYVHKIFWWAVAAANIYQCAGNNAYHVVQKVVGAQVQFNQFAVVFKPRIVNKAHGGAALAVAAAQAGAV